MCAFRASVRDQLDLMSLSGLDVDGKGEGESDNEPIGMPRVYHDPETDSEEDVLDVRPSAASEPGTGMLGMDVRIVFLAMS